MTDSNTATIPAIVRERVARGLAWIVEHGAAHGVDLDRVDLATLDITSPRQCVLGQARGGTVEATDDYRYTRSGYGAVLDSVFPGDRGIDAMGWSRSHGFDISGWDDTDPSVYAEAWRQAITVHRAGQ